MKTQVALAAACALGVLGEAGAAAAPVLVFEAHVGERTPEMSRALDQLDMALEEQGFAAKLDTIAKLVGPRFPRSGVSDHGKTAADIALLFNQGLEAASNADWSVAVHELNIALEFARRNPALMVIDTANLDLTFRSYVALALAHHRLHEDAATDEAMAETIRTFPQRPVTLTEYGPECDGLYRRVHKEIDKHAHGQLTITTGDDRAVIFVDGQSRGVGRVTLPDIIAGPYRVFIQAPGTPGRRYDVQVSGRTDLSVDLTEDALLASSDWVGFAFASEAEQTRNAARYAAGTARRWTDADSFVVITTARRRDTTRFVGSLYRTNGDRVREASAQPTGASFRALARFLGDGTPDASLEIRSGASRDERAAASLAPNTAWWYWPKTTTTVAAVALVTSAVLFAKNENDTGRTRTYTDTLPWAYPVAIGGALLAGVAVWQWTHRHSHGPQPVVSAGLGGFSIGVAGAFR